MFTDKLKERFSNNFIFNMNIRNRLLIFFLIIVIFPTSIIIVAVYKRSIGIITQRIDSSLKDSLNMAEINIMQKFEVINDISTFIYMNTDLVSILSVKYPPERPSYMASDRIDMINEMATLDKLLDSYKLSGITGMTIFPRIYMVNRPEYLQSNFSNKVSSLSLIETEEWYLNLPASARYTVVGLNNEPLITDSPGTIRVAKKLFGLKSPDIPYSALLTIDISVADFTSILEKFRPSKNSNVYVIDADSNIVINPDYSLLGEKLYEVKMNSSDINFKSEYASFKEKINNTEMLVTCKKISSLNWTIVAFCPVFELYGELISFRKIMYLILALCITLTVLLALFLSENLSYPIRKLINSMASVKEGNFEISFEYRRNDEFSYLIDTYKNMLEEIKQLIDKLYISEESKREAELKALQAQINPHFLYNTLDSVNWLALKYNAGDISTMVTSLSDFFRYTLSKGKNIIPLGDEKKQIESYLAIQKIRFMDKLDYNISFSQEILDYLTVKLILQPIVENSIIHGIEKKRGKGIIDITAEKVEDNIEIKISDNGVGGNIEEMNSLLHNRGETVKSYGIRNVNERIKQLFGEQYGIKFYFYKGTPTNKEIAISNESGVTALITIPAVKKWRG